MVHLRGSTFLWKLESRPRYIYLKGEGEGERAAGQAEGPAARAAHAAQVLVGRVKGF